jgi:hypothetical protein
MYHGQEPIWQEGPFEPGRHTGFFLRRRKRGSFESIGILSIGDWPGSLARVERDFNVNIASTIERM